MLTTWLIELYLNELGVLRDEGETERHRRLQKEFHDFLRLESLAVSSHVMSCDVMCYSCDVSCDHMY